MKLFYQASLATDTTFEVEEDEAKHLKALRIADGDSVHFTDGKGLSALCSIRWNKNKAIAEIQSQESHQPMGSRLTIIISPTKNIDRMEWFVEKATEIGIHRIIFCPGKNSERYHLKLDRLHRVCLAAMKQSIKYHLPEILTEESLESCWKNDATKSLKFIAHCMDTATRLPLSKQLKSNENAVICIGPEGDFSKDEIELAKQYGYTEVSLGQSRMRTETAALFAVCIFESVNQ